MNLRQVLSALLILTATTLQGQVVLLEDFATRRLNGEGTNLWEKSVNFNQSVSIEVNEGDARLRDDVTGTQTDFGQLVNYYVHFFPIQGGPRYPHPAGFTKSYIKSGTWNSAINRMEYWLKCSKTIPTEVSWSLNMGTYVKPPQANGDEQGTHYYHYFHPTIYANKWVKVEMNWTPTHLLGAPGSANHAADPLYPSVHYFDGLTRWYISIGQGSFAPMTCWVDDFKMFAETGEPDDKVRSITVTYTGSKYEVTWDARKNVSTPFEVRYSTSSMKQNGINSGTGGGTVNPPGNDYTGVVWSSPNMAENTNGMYFAIRPTDGSAFTEIYFPRYPASGSTPPDTQAPSAPTSLSAVTPTAGQVNLSWTGSTDNVGVAGYRLERCQGSTCSNFAQIATPTGTSYSDAGLAGNTSFRYRVRAADAAGNLSGYSGIAGATTPAPPAAPPADTVPPSAPSNLSAAAASAGQVNLGWTASTDNVGVTSYRVERCAGGTCSNFSQVGTTSSTSYNDSGLPGNATFRYRTRASDASGNLSSYSNIASTTTLATVSGLVAAYAFSEGSGSIVSDSSGNAHGGVVQGATWTGAGKAGGGLQFDGVNDQVTLTGFDVPTGGGLTLSAWFKANSLSASVDGRILSKAAGVGEQDHDWMLSTVDVAGVKRLRARVRIGGTTRTLIATSAALSTGQWVHAAVVYNGTTLKLYQNGTEVGTMNASGAVVAGSTAPAAVGDNPNGGQPFNGTIDEIRVYNVGLTQAEVQSDMNTPIGATTISCDINGNGVVDVSDVQLSVNAALGVTSCVSDVNGDGACTVVDTQRIVNAALGAACHVGT